MTMYDDDVDDEEDGGVEEVIEEEKEDDSTEIMVGMENIAVSTRFSVLAPYEALKAATSRAGGDSTLLPVISEPDADIEMAALDFVVGTDAKNINLFETFDEFFKIVCGLWDAKVSPVVTCAISFCDIPVINMTFPPLQYGDKVAAGFISTDQLTALTKKIAPASPSDVVLCVGE